jgi:hypothetical protein
MKRAQAARWAQGAIAGCSLWPTAKRFSPPLRIRHSGSQLLERIAGKGADKGVGSRSFSCSHDEDSSPELDDIPPDLVCHRPGNRSELEWLIDHYQVEPITGPGGDRVSDPDRLDDFPSNSHGENRPSPTPLEWSGPEIGSRSRKEAPGLPR